MFHAKHLDEQLRLPWKHKQHFLFDCIFQQKQLLLQKWGETPCAFIELAAGRSVDSEELRQWCRDHLAPYKVPGKFVFTDIPRTSTGKIQKFQMREQAKLL